MSEIKIRRRSRTFDAVLSTSTGVATTLRLEDFAGGVVDIGTTSTSVTTLNVYAGSTDAGPWRPLYDADGAAVTLTLAPSTADGRVYDLPPELFAVQYAKLVAADAAGEGVPAVVTIKS